MKNIIGRVSSSLFQFVQPSLAFCCCHFCKRNHHENHSNQNLGCKSTYRPSGKLASDLTALALLI
ncbi:Alkylhydroperoxidase protein D [Vibrio parahaemolyticus]